MNFQDKTIYQIYIKSFQDSNGDGIGDLNGITQRLDYLQNLGVDFLWITPFFASPQKDNGYDVSDYCRIDPMYGSMDDFEELVRQAKNRGIDLMLDMVFNHTSTDHEWFRLALEGDPIYKDYYIWRSAQPDGSPPTNWESKFGGSAWQYVTHFDQYYLHLFDISQADVNWDNPAVRAEYKKVLEFWIGKGVRGFRFDVINLISKPEEYSDDARGDGRRMYTDGHNVHTYLKELCAPLHEAGIVTVGEMSSTSIEHCVRYSNPAENELSMCFNFHHLKADYVENKKWELAPLDLAQLKLLLYSWQVGLAEGAGWGALFWSNHDQPRIVSRFGSDGELRVVSAKMLAGVLYLLRGTPYVYQGEEIGMTNAYFSDISRYKDVESINYYQATIASGISTQEALQVLQARSRDNSRTPMQWLPQKLAGFTTGKPWIEVNTNYAHINVAQAVDDPNSLMWWYKSLIMLRKSNKTISIGAFEPLFPESAEVLAYRRAYNEDSIVVIANFVEKTPDIDLREFSSYECVMSNYDRATDFVRNMTQVSLRPYEILVLSSSRSNGKTHF